MLESFVYSPEPKQELFQEAVALPPGYAVDKYRVGVLKR